MLKRFYPIIIVVMFFLLNIPMITPIISQTATADTEYWTDWVIDNETTRTGETIVVHEDVIVENGGSLTLDNCVLKIDSWIPGHNGIEVEAGGELCVYNTTITAYQPYQYYIFDVSGKLQMEGADISNMMGSRGWGLYVKNTDDVMIKNCRIHDSGVHCDGITIDDSTMSIESTVIYNTYFGIRCLGSSNAMILTNTIRSNNFGVEITNNATGLLVNNDLSNNLDRGFGADEDAKVTLYDNIVSNNLFGLQFGTNAAGEVLNNTVSSNKDTGINCFDNVTVNISGNTISDNEKYGIAFSDNSVGNIVSNSISYSGKWGVACVEDAIVDIAGNTITNNGDDGIVVENNVQAVISGNTINSNDDDGIVCLHSSATKISNNIISQNGMRGLESRLSASGKLTADNNYFYANVEGGIFVDLPSCVELNNNTIMSNIVHGIEIAGGATPFIANCTISDSGKYDLRIYNNSHPTIVNTKLDLNKLSFNDTESIVSVGYWVELNVRNSNNTPVQNARVIIANNDSIEIFNGSTNYEGRICSMPVIALDMDYTDKKNYTPHTIYVAKTGLSESEQIIVDSNRVVDFILAVSDKLARGNLITANVDGHDITVEYSGDGNITITPVTNPPPVPKDKKDIGIFFNITATGTVEEIYITVHYNPEDYVPGTQGAVLKMYFWDGSAQEWIPVSESGVDVHNQLVWVSIDHLTIFAPMAEEISKPVSSGNVWLLYGVASITSFAILFVAYIILKRKILLQSKTGK